MAWHLQIGVDRDLLKKVDPIQNERQTYIFSLLSIMLITVASLCFFSSIIYMLIVFHNWIIAILVAVFLSLVVFNLYRLFVMTALDVSGSSLEEYYLDHEKHYRENLDIGKKLGNISDEKIQEIVYVAKDKLREKAQIDIGQKPLTAAHILTMTIRVVVLSIIAIVFATGIELFIFSNQINDVLDQLKLQYSSHGDTWMVENIFTPNKGENFIIFNSNSLLLNLDLLVKGLGFWKIIFDIVFLTIFLLPLIIVFKSKEIKQSEYMQELVLSEMTITFYHFLHTQKLCENIFNEIQKQKISYSKSNK